jgi:transcriptional regulator with XRE-family HTH domain
LLDGVNDQQYCAFMTQQPPDAQPAVGPVETIARRVRELRRRRGWSAAQLAEQLRAAGLDWDRNIVANLETGRRASVSVGELLALAYVLNVAPVHLLVPLDNKTPYQVTPILAEPAWAIRRWVGGRRPLTGTDRRLYFFEVPEADWPVGYRSMAVDVDEEEPEEEAVRRAHDQVRHQDDVVRRIVAEELERQRAAEQERSDG